MAREFSFTPAKVDEMPLVSVALMLYGAMERRAENWYLNAQVLAQMWNTGYGSEKAKRPNDYMPAFYKRFLSGDDSTKADLYAEMERSWGEAQKSDYIMRVRQEMMMQQGLIPDFPPEDRARLEAEGKIPDVSGFDEMPVYKLPGYDDD